MAEDEPTNQETGSTDPENDPDPEKTDDASGGDADPAGDEGKDAETDNGGGEADPES